MYFSDDKSADKSSLLRDTSVTADTCADKTLSAYQLRGHLFCVDNVESSPKARTIADNLRTLTLQHVEGLPLLPGDFGLALRKLRQHS